MEGITWVSFCCFPPLCKTIVHILPDLIKTRGATVKQKTAKQQTVKQEELITCRLKLFGESVKTQVIQLDGLLSSHPEGIEIDKIFAIPLPAIDEWYGLIIELNAGQNSLLDLQPSRCTIELRADTESLFFLPKLLETVSNRFSSGGDLNHFDRSNCFSKGRTIFFDNAVISSIIGVNCAPSEARFCCQGDDNILSNLNPSILTTLPPLSAVELRLEESSLADPDICGLSSVKLSGPGVDPASVYYVAHRQRSTGRLIGVEAL